MNLNDREWIEFKVEDIFLVLNSTSYHKKNLKSSNSVNNSIPYITRTNQNNGLEEIVEKKTDFKTNPANSIVFGAENATFFYQPFEYITGNKMYNIQNEELDEKTGLFLQQILNTSVKDCGFSYGQGLTGTREKRRGVMLPVLKDDNSKPDWNFMRLYVEKLKLKKIKGYIEYIRNIQSTDEELKSINLEDIKWKEFYICGKDGIFEIKSTSSGIDKNKIENSSDVNIPYITRTDICNGINLFISEKQKNKYKIDSGNTITIGLDTQTVFYQPYKFYTGQNIQVLSHPKLNKYNALFIIPLIKIQMNKFNWGGNGATLSRLSRTKIMLPIDKSENPDWNFMEQYIKCIYLSKINTYINHLTNTGFNLNDNQKQKED